MSAGRESALFLEEPLEIIVPALNQNQPAPSDQNRFDVARIEKLVASAMPNMRNLAKFLKWYDFEAIFYSNIRLAALHYAAS